MSTRSFALLLTISLMLFVVACSNGYTDEEVDATVNAAYRVGQEASIDAAPKKAFWEATKVEFIVEINNVTPRSCNAM
jgi:hypothetical protein